MHCIFTDAQQMVLCPHDSHHQRVWLFDGTRVRCLRISKHVVVITTFGIQKMKESSVQNVENKKEINQIHTSTNLRNRFGIFSKFNCRICKSFLVLGLHLIQQLRYIAV